MERANSSLGLIQLQPKLKVEPKCYKALAYFKAKILYLHFRHQSDRAPLLDPKVFRRKTFSST